MTNDGVNPNSVNENAGATRVEVWRQEFPVEQAEEFRVTRRGFGAMLCGACVVGAVGVGVVRAAEGESAVTAAEGNGDEEGGRFIRAERADAPFRAMLAVELPAGSGHAVRNPATGQPILLLRTEAGELRAYDQRCTHLLCPVHYEPKSEERSASIHCPCHHGYFDPATGAPTAGPPRRALPRFAVTVEEGWIVVAGREQAT